MTGILREREIFSGKSFKDIFKMYFEGNIFDLSKYKNTKLHENNLFSADSAWNPLYVKIVDRFEI